MGSKQSTSTPETRQNYGDTECPPEAMNMDLWSNDDPWYSNQANTNTCVRHALAKALWHNQESDKL